ncbi:MAG: class II aldolase/adducin family protein [Nitrososphaerota archaeon]|nr:class II aldolase/adducin family protein [Nitrososphaerota archaeon]
MEEFRYKLAIGNRILVNEGLTELGRGHMVYYLGDGKMMIPAHLHNYERSIADCKESDIVTIDLDGRVIEGKYPSSMGEFYFYSELFSRRSDVRAAAHFHPYYANLLVMSGKELLMMSRDSFVFVDGIPVHSGLPLYIGNRSDAAQLVNKMGRSNVVMHRGHGAFVAGTSIENVTVTAAALERACKKQFMAYQVGTPLVYDKDEIKRTTSKDLVEDLAATDWSYFVSRLEKRVISPI